MRLGWRRPDTLPLPSATISDEFLESARLLAYDFQEARQWQLSSFEQGEQSYPSNEDVTIDYKKAIAARFQ